MSTALLLQEILNKSIKCYPNLIKTYSKIFYFFVEIT